MSKRMLIDATQPEETRVVLVSGKRVDDFDFEIESRKTLRGNIYLARVTRVEPSLQAAFVEYGGNRHGFLAFNEIHPDYYRIPVEDREELLAAEARDPEEEEGEPSAADDGADEDEGDRAAADDGGDDGDGGDLVQDDEDRDGDEGEDGDLDRRHEAAAPETLGGDAMEEAEESESRRRRPARRYRIQEVITRRQIMLVQVLKEERGTKGAALTTYLSLAGRYCVLMPNTARGGGVSRKITNAGDRKRLKTVVEGLGVPEGMAVIVRTAGSERTRAEIRRDYDYLLRLWGGIRDTTLNSIAPAMIYEEANLIKRSIRDLYSRDIDEVLVEGDAGYRTAKSFMRALVPSHAKRVQPYRNGVPLFQRYQIENQLDAIHDTVVQLRSGGYVVLNQTEALVAIDVNSGRSTRERGIEATALKTNLEAADEVARQLRLRDLAGLIVIDFIDMDENRNRHAVERRMKDAMRNDRARIQIGRISHFGLMEMSRQRLRPSLFESSTQICRHCRGSGRIRSTESAALHVLRAIEEEGMRQRAATLAVHVPAEVALYIMNQKRVALAEIETRYGFFVSFGHDESLVPPDHRIERLETKSAADRLTLVAETPEEEAPPAEAEASESGNGRRERKGRRRRRADRRTESTEIAATAPGEAEAAAEAAAGEGGPATPDPAAEAAATPESEDDEAGRRRRRGKRGGRRRGRRGREEEAGATAETGGAEAPADTAAPEAGAAPADGEAAAEGKPARPARRSRRRSSGRRGSATADTATDTVAATEADAATEAAEADQPATAVPEPEAPVAGVAATGPADAEETAPAAETGPGVPAGDDQAESPAAGPEASVIEAGESAGDDGESSAETAEETEASSDGPAGEPADAGADARDGAAPAAGDDAAATAADDGNGDAAIAGDDRPAGPESDGRDAAPDLDGGGDGQLDAETADGETGDGGDADDGAGDGGAEDDGLGIAAAPDGDGDGGDGDEPRAGRVAAGVELVTQVGAAPNPDAKPRRGWWSRPAP